MGLFTEEDVSRPAMSRSAVKWPAESSISVAFSNDGKHRFELIERWDAKKPMIMWLMMNPATADMQFSDRTLRKTGSYSRAWGYGAQAIGNVHSFRAKDPQDLRRAFERDDAVRPENDECLKQMALEADIIMLAYGQPPHAELRARSKSVVEMLNRHLAETFEVARPDRMHVLRLAQDGTPMHPLYLPGDLKPQRITV